MWQSNRPPSVETASGVDPAVPVRVPVPDSSAAPRSRVRARVRERIAVLVCTGVLSSVAACGEEDEGNDPVEDEDHGSHDAHQGDGGAQEEVPCTPDYPTFRPDLAVTAGALTVRLRSVEPAPPRQKVPNDWVLEVVDESGAPLTDFKVEGARTFMEVHGHYGRTDPKVVEQPDPGQFKLDDLSFQMRGPWLVVFGVKPASGPTAPVRFKICVE